MRRPVVLLLPLLCLSFAVSSASASTSRPGVAAELRVVDHDVVALASDRDRYAIWGTLDGRIGTYDGQRGRIRRVALTVSCTAPVIDDVHGAEAIVSCSPGPSLLVRLDTGRATVLGAPWVTGQASPETIGSRWIRGIVACSAPSHLCDQYVDRSTGAASVRPRSATVYDLDQASRPRVERCASATKDFATMTSAWPWYITGGGGDPVWLGRCGHGKILLTKDFEMSGVAVGPSHAIWHDPSSVWVRDLSERQTHHWQPGGVVGDAVTAGDHLLIADEPDNDLPRIGYVANLLLTTIPHR